PVTHRCLHDRGCTGSGSLDPGPAWLHGEDRPAQIAVPVLSLLWLLALLACPAGALAQTAGTVGLAQQPAAVADEPTTVASPAELTSEIGPRTVTVTANAELPIDDSVTTTTSVDREDIERTPGADRSNSLGMITDFVPGAYVVHDQLHVRGGHQTSWAIDGVEIPNTNIASNLGPQIDPKDIQSLEVERGAYGAELGDRTYGIFNVAPKTGFDRTNQGDLV